MFCWFGKCYCVCFGSVYFCIVDLDKEKVFDILFCFRVGKEVKRDMDEVIRWLIGNNVGYMFSYCSNFCNVVMVCFFVDGKKRSFYEGFDRDFCLRIDI